VKDDRRSGPLNRPIISTPIDASAVPLDATNHKFLRRVPRDQATFAIRRAAWEEKRGTCTRRKAHATISSARCIGVPSAIRPRAGDINAAKERERNTAYCGLALRCRELSSRRRATGRNIIRRPRNILRKSNTPDRQSTRQKAPSARRKSPRESGPLRTRGSMSSGHAATFSPSPLLLLLLPLSRVHAGCGPSSLRRALCSVALRSFSRDHTPWPSSAATTKRRASPGEASGLAEDEAL